MHKKRVALYIRVSTQEQVKEGFGLVYQQQNLNDLVAFKAKTDGWITKPEWCFVDEGLSGATLKRPAYQRLMKAVKRKAFDIVVVWKIDRISRSLSDLLKVYETLQKYDVGLYSLKENMDYGSVVGKLSLQLLGSIAEFEKSNTRARCAEGRLASARAGNVTITTAPYAYKRVRTEQGARLQIVTELVEWVRKMYTWFVHEHKTYEEITRQLQLMEAPKGTASKQSKAVKWRAAHVKRILQNETYTGNLRTTIKDSENQPQEVVIPVPKIIDKGLYEAAQERIGSISKTNKTKGRKSLRFLLSRKLYDTETGKRYVGYKRSKDARLQYRRQGYFAADGTRFKNTEVPAEPLERFVKELITSLVCTPEQMYEQYLAQQKKGVQLEEITAKLHTIIEKIKSIETRQVAIHEDFYAGNISHEMREKLLETSKLKTEKLTEMREIMEKKLKAALELHQSAHSFEAFSALYKSRIEYLSQAKWKQLIHLVIEKISLTKHDNYIDAVVELALPNPQNKPKCEPDFDYRFVSEETSHQCNAPCGTTEKFITRVIQLNIKFLLNNYRRIHKWVFNDAIEIVCENQIR